MSLYGVRLTVCVMNMAAERRQCVETGQTVVYRHVKFAVHSEGVKVFLCSPFYYENICACLLNSKEFVSIFCFRAGKNKNVMLLFILTLTHE